MRRVRAMVAVVLLAAAPVHAAETTLNVAASADLTALDPMGPAATGTYIHGLLVYDTLFAQDETLHVKPQMIGDETVSADHLQYRLTLRPGLLFQDGSPVTTKDVIASLRRWMKLDIVGRTMAIDVKSMDAVDDGTFTITMGRPFPVEQALANNGSGLPVIFRAKEAEAGAFTKDTPIIGSGPFRFNAAEWRPGDRIVYDKFTGYKPRDEPANGFAGGKVAQVDHVVFHVIPDAATKSAALQAGEVDFIDAVPFDVADALVGRKGITVAPLSRITNPFFMRPNTLYPPFDNEKARQALALAVNRADYMAVAFTRPEWGIPCLSFFVCGSPNATTAGSEAYAQPNLARARELLKESGYKGEKVVLLSSHETLFVGQAADYAAENLKQIGLNIDEVESDWGTFMARRNSKKPPEQGGWNIFLTSVSGSGLADPLSDSIADTTCGGGNFAGWPCDQQAADLRDSFIHEGDEGKRRDLLDQLSRRLWQVIPTVLLGQRVQLYAWRDNVTINIHPPSLVTAFWGIEKK